MDVPKRKAADCQLPPTWEGGVELISDINLSNITGFLSRTDQRREQLISPRYYKFVRRSGEVDAPPTPEEQENNPIAMASDLVRGSSWMGMDLGYVARSPGPLSLKLPASGPLIACVCRNLDLGALAPLLAIIKYALIIARATVDLLTASSDPLGFWFYASLVSLLWPLISMLNYVVNGGGSEDICSTSYIVHVPRSNTTRSERRSLSRRSGRASRTASDSENSRKSQEMNIEEQCHGIDLYMSKNIGLLLTRKRIAQVNIAWNRAHQEDPESKNAGRPDRFFPGEWGRLFSAHSQRY